MRAGELQKLSVDKLVSPDCAVNVTPAHLGV